ncbi:hypothetical protein BXO88_02960 [Oribacterium sp. C9]|uniref:helix-turn-helix domain-containing protein n=1 Tax=Oribacterium sp. C9 TaxID=1943579 RepID=UPI00098FFFD5|nr:helix-turn-helix transcriptional regulator [Oribacterium sp. C9]OON87650.1 hypothetical protein BXO88_02960 [Oribacterium sp. C9]
MEATVSYEKYADIRDRHGVRDIQVARDTGIAKSCISGWKHGSTHPKMDKLLKLAIYFGCKIEDFLKD